MIALTTAAQENVTETATDVAADIAAIRSGAHTRESLLAHCLDGADVDRVEGWHDYVDAVVAAAESAWSATISIGIRKWAVAAGGAEIEWEVGEGDTRLVGWVGADGTRAIDTNGDPLWSERDEGFDEAWKSRSLDPREVSS